MLSKATVTFHGIKRRLPSSVGQEAVWFRTSQENAICPFGEKKKGKNGGETDVRESWSKGRKKKEKNIYILPELLTRSHNGMQQVRKCRSFQL